VFRVFGVSWWAAVLFQIFLGAATTLFLYRIGEKRLARGVGLFAALWLSLYVHQIHFACALIRDVLSTFLFTWFLYTIVKQFYRMRSAVWTGLVFTLLIHVDPVYVTMLPFAVIFLLLAATHHRLLNVQYVFIFVTAVFLFSMPWAIRNYVVYREPVPISFEAARFLPTLGQRSSPRAIEESSENTTQARTNSPTQIDNLTEVFRVVRLTESVITGDRIEPPWSRRHNVASVLNYGILLPFFFLGGAYAFRRRNRAAIVLVFAFLYQFTLKAFLNGGERGRLPIEPIIILIAFYGISEGMATIRNRRQQTGD
jgi:4-amino-4-deoxy-L-arabinose transferase-like glycosyltransferase